MKYKFTLGLILIIIFGYGVSFANNKQISVPIDKGIKVILLTPTGDTRAKTADSKDPLNKHAQ